MASQQVASSGPPGRLRCPLHLYPVGAVFDQQVFKLKAVYLGREMELDLSVPSMDAYTLTAFKSKLQDVFNVVDVKLTYTDEDNDIVSIDSQEEFKEALKVGKALGTLRITVTKKETNPYVEDLHLKLSAQRQSEPMDVDQPSPASSFVKVSHSDVPVEIKYPPSIKHSRGHYADLACMIGSERRKSTPNKYVSGFHSRYRNGISPPPVPNPYVESLQSQLTPVSAPPTQAHNEYVEAIHTQLSGKTSSSLSLTSGAKPAPSNSSEAGSGKNEYVEEIDAQLQKIGRSRGGRGTCKYRERKKEWISNALKQESQVIVDELQKGLNGVIEVLSEGKGCGPSVSPHGNGPIHFNIVCDGCHNMIVGARYKCGNCSDYDLCEWCEPLSETLHPVDHVFLKLKTPGRRIGANCKGNLKPLLRKNLYHHHCHDPCSSSDEERKVEVKRQKKMDKEKRHHHHHKRQPPSLTTNDSTVMTAGYVSRPREQIRQEVAANKLRKREEKKNAKLEGKIDKLQTRLASVNVGEAVKKEKEDKSKLKGHGKYLDCQFLTDTSYPDDSVVPFQMPFEKGWLVMNSGTKKWKHVKLVFQDGYRPLTSVIVVPELKPGERVELVAQYPPVSDRELPFIQSCWRLVHKESTPFGPVLWLSVAVDNQPTPTAPPLTTLTPSHTEVALTMETPASDEPSAPPLVTDETKNAQNEPDPASSFQIVRPITLEMSSEDESEQLIQTFDMIETPNSVHSLSSNDSFHQTPDKPIDMDDDKEETASLHSNNSEDFVVVIPDCFDLSKPLPGYTPPQIESEFPSVMTLSHDSHMMLSLKQEPEVKSKPTPTPPAPAETTSPNSTPPTARKEFVPQRLTLKNVKDARMFKPLSLATGFMNTVSDLVSERVKFSQSEKVAGTTVDKPAETLAKEEPESEEEFEDAPEAPTSGAMPTATPPQPWKTEQLSDVSPLLPTVLDASQWVQSDEDNSKWCQSPDVSHLLPRPWNGPKPPNTPMEKLISMGFADRVLNQQLLDKHNNNMPMVLNELLDGCHGNTKRLETIFI